MDIEGELNTSSGGNSNMAPVFYMNVKSDQTGGSWNHSYTFSILHMLTIIHLIIADDKHWEIQMSSSNFNFNR